MKNQKVRIGELVKEKLIEEGHSAAWLARKVNLDPSNFRRKLRKDSMDTELLIRISNALRYNFFDYFKD